MNEMILSISFFTAFCKKSAYNVGLQSFDRLSFINIEETTNDEMGQIQTKVHSDNSWGRAQWREPKQEIEARKWPDRQE